MSEVHAEIRVISDSKQMNKAVINVIDEAIIQYSNKYSNALKEVSIEFKNIRTRERKPKLSPIETVELDSNGEEEAPSGDK